MELTAYVRVIRRRWRMVAIAMVLGIGLGAASMLLVPKSSATANARYYKATHQLLATKDVNLPQVEAYATEGDVPRRVADRIGGNPTNLAGSTFVDASPQASLVSVTSYNTDANRAAQMSDAFAEELVKYQIEVQDRARQANIDALNQQREVLRQQYQDVLDRGKDETDEAKLAVLKQAKDELIQKGKDNEKQVETLQKQTAVVGSLTSLSTAEPSLSSEQAFTDAIASRAGKKTTKAADATTADTAPKSSREIGLLPRLGIGAAVGLLLGLILVLLIERLDPRIRTKEQAEAAYGWPVIAEVPPLNRRQQKAAEVLVYAEPRSRAAEAFRVLRSSVLFASVSEAAASNADVAVGNGAGTVNGNGTNGKGNATNGNGTKGASPAVEGAEADATNEEPTQPKRGQVLLITSPGPSEGKTTTAANLAGAIAETGYRVLIVNCDFRRPRLADFFNRQPGPGEIVGTSIPGVDILNEVVESADDVSPAVVLAAQRKAIHTHVMEYDVVLLDTAPMLTTNDAVDVLIEADAVVVVGRSGKTPKEAADRAAEALERRNAPVIGVVLVGAAETPTNRYYYYGGKKEGYYTDGRRRTSFDKDADPSKELAPTANP